MEDLGNLFERLKENDSLNTSYPLRVKDWDAYRVQESLSFDDERELAFYIHIPFCRQLCSFCEYCRMPSPSAEIQKKYLRTIESDINRFISRHKHISLYGFDIGGGTPTSLDESCFRLLMDIYDNTVSRLNRTADFEPSIEATFQTLTIDKIRRIAQSGIKRISLGVQTTDSKLLADYHRRTAQIEEMQHWMDVIHECGIEKINLDMMYGLDGQNEKSIENDITVLQMLHPEQITLYELRPNMIGCHSIDKLQCYNIYNTLWQGIHEMGYRGRFGQNTFSLDRDDFGMSSYLRYRMLNGKAYKGFGISAQSMSKHGLSYNIGKLSKNPTIYLNIDGFPEEYTYKLPTKERLAKFISISAYSGSLSLQGLSKIIGLDANSFFSKEIQFALSEGLFTKEDDTLYITRKGFKYYGATFALFYNVVD